jgi:uncharacterized protein (TIGR03437 family)
MTPDGRNPCHSVYRIPSTYAKHLSADGTRQLYGTFLDDMIGLDGRGVARVSDSVSVYRTVDLSAPQLPQITCVVNAATLLVDGIGVHGAISAGEMITIFGPSIGPDQATVYRLTPEGSVASVLDSLQVLVGGLAAPILYASKNQINVVAPFALPSAGNVAIEVVRSGMAVGSFSVTAAAASPGIFAQNGRGTGPGLIFNQDGTLNRADNPAQSGSILSIYVTGLGRMVPQPVDGSIPAFPFAKPALPIQAFLFTSGYRLSILYAGDAPQAIEGIQQINIQLPTAPLQVGLSTIRILAENFGSVNVPVFYE